MKAKVFDCFEIKARMVGSDHSPGAIVVFDGSAFDTDQLPTVGTCVTIHPLMAQPLMAVVGERKHHGDGVSLFFADLTCKVIPIGSTLEWSQSLANMPVAVKS